MTTRPAPLFPRRGAWRVSPSPLELPELPRKVTEVDTPLGRWDDPEWRYRVRYAADELRTCLREKLASFRVRPSLEERIAELSDPEDEYDADFAYALADLDGEALEPPAVVPQEYLAIQRVGRVLVLESGVWFADMTDPDQVARYDGHIRVRLAMKAIQQRFHLREVPRLDMGWVQMGYDDLGRPVTQALSRAVYEGDNRPNGIVYESRFDRPGVCWALFDHTRVDVVDIVPLTPGNTAHRAAVEDAARIHRLVLPDPWTRPMHGA